MWAFSGKRRLTKTTQTRASDPMTCSLGETRERVLSFRKLAKDWFPTSVGHSREADLVHQRCDNLPYTDNHINISLFMNIILAKLKTTFSKHQPLDHELSLVIVNPHPWYAPHCLTARQHLGIMCD